VQGPGFNHCPEAAELGGPRRSREFPPQLLLAGLSTRALVLDALLKMTDSLENISSPSSYAGRIPNCGGISQGKGCNAARTLV